MKMKTIGLIGGMSWVSTLDYYRLLNQGVAERLGGYHSARILLDSVDFADIEALQVAGDWQTAGQLLALSARRLEQAGADGIVLCTNTMHECAAQIQGAVRVPFLHIADATGEAVQSAGLHRVGLLGTCFTMERDFYRGRLSQNYGLEVLTPPEKDREIIHRVIFDELVQDVITEESRNEYSRIIADLKQAGAQGVILGCTEIALLIQAADSALPIFDTTQLHADAALNFMLAQE
jgi:aspartate racemase